MSNLQKRIITGILAGSLTVFVIYNHFLGLLAFCLLVSVLSFYEYLTLQRVTRVVSIPFWLGSTLLWAAIALVYIADFQQNSVIWWLQMIIVPFSGAVALYRKPIQQSFQQWGLALAGYAYIFIPLVLLFELAFPVGRNSYAFMGGLGILLLMWAADVGAYFVGKYFGKHFIFPSVSPKKTWEGFLGGILFTILTGVILQKYSTLPDRNWIVCGVLIAAFGLYGDLFESLMKRNADQKDSGTLLPGHGGFLDRFDGIFFAIPPVYLYIQLSKLFA